MRPAGRGSHESLYFDYPHFDPPRAREHDGDARSHKVAIVGAGPVGMTAALTLARYGIASVLLDRKDTFNDGSRAICIARASMHILDRIGAVAPFLDKALGWRFGRSYYRGEQVYRLEMPHSVQDKYLPMYNLQQQYIEQFLHAAVAQSPLIEMRWQSEVTDIVQTGILQNGILQPGITQQDSAVDLAVASPHGSYRMRASYVLAADGARSPIRAMLGLRLKGENHEGRYVIADVRMALDWPTERRAYFGTTSVPGGTLLMHKQPDDLWRIDYQLRDDESDDDVLTEPNLRRRLQAILNEIGYAGRWDLEWWSVYTANTLALDDYRHGRVLFVGDAAHIVPIFGVRGLNNGLADAHNIGWKLAMVLAGLAGDRLLDSYTPERRGATLDVFANATKSTRFMTPPTRGWWLAREAALSLALRHEFPRGLANPRQMQPHSYADCPLTLWHADESRFTAGPRAGAFAPDVALPDGRYLLDHAGDGFTLVTFADQSIRPMERQRVATLRRIDPRLTHIIVALPDAAIADADADATLKDDTNAISERYGAAAGTVYLLRPDLHVASRWLTFDGEAIARALRASLGDRSS
jgi:3-(3-hydroxy-phenyl)propionate hydroxylase